MTNTAVQIIEKGAIFGRAPRIPAVVADRSVSLVLYRRLSEKSEGYDRAATRLELRGETDAARVLRRAASRLRTITRPTPAFPEEAA